MKRILVIGCCGSGKTTFSKRLGELLNIEVVHLDAHYWKPGWVEPPKPAWENVVDELVRRDTWVMDGNYSGTLERRLAACDAVIFLDVSRLICIWRVLKRTVRGFNTTRPEMAAGCPERLSLQFLLWVWGYPNRSRPKIVKLLSEYESGRDVFRLSSDADIAEFWREQEKSVRAPADRLRN